MSPALRAERTLKLTRRDAAIEDAQRFAAGAVSFCTPECREAVTLAVCELGENLIKYGGAPDDPNAGTISVSIEDDRVSVRATSRVSSAEDARRVHEIVARLAGPAVSVQELYRARLQQLFENPGLPRAELGLLRMAFEGGFRLSCRFEQSELHIVAERACTGGT